MHEAIGLVFFGLMVVFSWGFYDAHRTYHTTSDYHVKTEVGTPWHVQFDTLEALKPYEYGRVVIKVKWVPQSGESLAGIRLKGTLVDGETELENFDESCVRGNSTNLRVGVWYHGADASTLPVCFIKLKTEFPIKHSSDGYGYDGADHERVREKIETLQLRSSSYKAYAGNKPMRYVVWTEDAFTNFLDGMVYWVTYPFTRV